MTRVKVGQVWEDWDIRNRAGHVYRRRFTIVAVGTTHATVQGVTRTRIHLDRFKPNSTGYRLVRDV